MPVCFPVSINPGNTEKRAVRMNQAASIPEKAKKRSKMGKQEKRFFLIGLGFALPWIIGFLCFQLYPILSAFYYSLTDYSIFKPEVFVGFKNYIKLFQDRYFPISIKNTAYMAVFGLPVRIVFALLIALLLNRNVKGMPLFRTIYYLPTLVPIVASAMLFIWVMNPEYGLVNNFLKIFGLTGPSWLSDPKYTKISLIIMDVWRCGQDMIIFMAALKAVPLQLYEAAEIDGAGAFKRFFRITLPSISPTIQFIIVMGLISTFQYFTQAYVFASVSNVSQTITGGPSNSLLFYSLYLYQQAFSFLKMGYASAMAIVLFIIVMIVTFFAMRIMESRVNYDLE